MPRLSKLTKSIVSIIRSDIGEPEDIPISAELIKERHKVVMEYKIMEENEKLDVFAW